MRRYILRATLRCHTALHLGGLASTPATDKSLARDGQGRLYLPGTSLAGILRAMIETKDKEAANALFGYQKYQEGQRSALLVNHGYFLPGFPMPEIRDLVHINPCWGVAENQHKFDMEVLPADAHFSLRLEYLDYAGENKKARQEAAHEAFMALTKTLIPGTTLTIPEKTLTPIPGTTLQVGGGFAKGLGRIGVTDEQDIAIWKFEFPCTEAAKQYFQLIRLENEQTSWSVVPYKCDIPPLPLKEINATWLPVLPIEIQLNLIATGPFLISRDAQGKTVDREPYQENGRYVVPGSSIRGALRQRAMRIVNTLLQSWGYYPTEPQTWTDVGESIIEALFGSTKKASILGVSDCLLPKEAVLQEVHNVAIDRFTCGARDGRLFSSYVFWSKNKPLPLDLSITIKQRRLENSEKDALLGLLAHVLYDLATEDIAIGHAKTSGHGRVKGCKLTIQNWEPEKEPITIADFANLSKVYAQHLQQLQSAFMQWLKTKANELVGKNICQNH